MQICGGCKEEKPLEQFSPSRRGKTGEYCKPCMSDVTKRNYRENKRSAVLMSKYGIDEARYLELYVNQYGKCLICGTFQDVLHVDHNHATGEVRGLLCGSCNTPQPCDWRGSRPVVWFMQQRYRIPQGKPRSVICCSSISVAVCRCDD